MLGYAFMGKAHSNGYKKIPYMLWPPPARPRLVAICGRNEAGVTEAARRYGYARAYTDWREMLKDDAVQVFDNGGPNNVHAEPCIAAAEAGKHIICEKPLARSAAEAKQMLEAVQKAGVKHACAFNYRFVPAVYQARNSWSRDCWGRSTTSGRGTSRSGATARTSPSGATTPTPPARAPWATWGRTSSTWAAS